MWTAFQSFADPVRTTIDAEKKIVLLPSNSENPVSDVKFYILVTVILFRRRISNMLARPCMLGEKCCNFVSLRWEITKITNRHNIQRGHFDCRNMVEEMIEVFIDPDGSTIT